MKKNINKNKKIYWLGIDDIQEVAEQELDRKLNEKELKLVSDKIGNYINWFDSISFAIQDLILNKRKDKKVI